MRKTFIMLFLAMFLIAGIAVGTRLYPPLGRTPLREKPPRDMPAKDTVPPNKPGDYFPLSRGSTWVYEGEGNEFASFTREVLFTSANRAQLMEDNGGTIMASVFTVSDSEVTRIITLPESYDGRYLLDEEPNDLTVILKSPLEVGTRWNTPNGEREIVATDATVETPAGTFKDCLKIRIAGTDSTLFEYFKEGVGMVKREFISGETRVTSALKSFSIK